MADQFMLKRFKGVFRVTNVALVDPAPIDEVRAAGPALAAVGGGHFSLGLETVQISLAVGRGARDLERRWLLKLSH
jgi:hypothetical protein